MFALVYFRKWPLFCPKMFLQSFLRSIFSFWTVFSSFADHCLSFLSFCVRFFTDCKGICFHHFLYTHYLFLNILFYLPVFMFLSSKENNEIWAFYWLAFYVILTDNYFHSIIHFLTYYQDMSVFSMHYAIFCRFV